MLSEAKLEEIRARLKPLEEAEARAKLLVSSIPKGQLFTAIAGVTVGFDTFDVVDGLITIRKVTNAPGMVHVARAAKRSAVALAIARYSAHVNGELVIGHPGISNSEHQFMLNLSWHTLALLKLKLGTGIFCPAAATCSWDTMSIADGSVDFFVLDDVPIQIILTDNQPMAARLEDVEWVKQHWDAAFDLRNAETSRRFGLALNILYTWNHTSNIRTAIALVWAALEALFGEKTDRPISAQLAERISAWVPSVSYEEIRELYNSRCDAVHGRDLNSGHISEALGRSQSVLRASLIRCVETGSKTLPDWQ